MFSIFALSPDAAIFSAWVMTPSRTCRTKVPLPGRPSYSLIARRTRLHCVSIASTRFAKVIAGKPFRQPPGLPPTHAREPLFIEKVLMLNKAASSFFRGALSNARAG